MRGQNESEVEKTVTEKSYEEYLEVKSAYDNFLVDHGEVFSEFFPLLRDLGEATEKVRTHLRHDADAPMSIGKFRKAVSSKFTIDAYALIQQHPEIEEELEGLVVTTKSIDPAVLKGYLASGEITQEMLTAVSTEVESTRMYGPKPAHKEITSI